MRQSWIQDPKTNKLITHEKYEAKYGNGSREAGYSVIPDTPDFVSPVTREVIHGRGHMKRHMKEHGITHTSDFKNHWKDKEKERATGLTSQSAKKRRTQDIVDAVNYHERQN
jgi:hypothetical protein